MLKPFVTIGIGWLLAQAAPTLAQTASSIYLLDDRVQQQIPVVSDETALSGRNTAWIIPHSSASDDAPAMPELKVRLLGAKRDDRISWQLEVTYRRLNGRALPEDTVRVPRSGPMQTVGDAFWDVYRDYAAESLFGGRAILTCQVNGGTPKEFFFWIAGKNPDAIRCKAFIMSESQRLGTSSNRNLMWYADAIAREETEGEGAPGFYNQFFASGSAKKDAMTNNPGCPNWHDDGPQPKSHTRKVGGFGLLQVTGWMGDENGNVPRSVIWNWKANVTAGLEEISRDHLKPCWAKMAELRAIARKPVPPLVVKGVRFADGSDCTIEDAVTIKDYNAHSKWTSPDPDVEPPPPQWFYTGTVAASGDYCYWDAKNNRWALSRYNSWGFNYVEKVCTVYKP